MKTHKLTRREFMEVGLKSAVGAGLALTGIGIKEAYSATKVTSLWSGALTPTSVRVIARLEEESDAVRLAVSTDASLNNPQFSQPSASRNSNSRLISFTMDNLTPHTQYYYALDIEGQLERGIVGQFRTPDNKPFSFSFASASCAPFRDGPVYDAMLKESPLLFLHTGDLHYRNIAENDPELFREAYRKALTVGSDQARFFQRTPFAYIWDDHDYGGDDADKYSPSREAARQAYQEYVPHYPLAAGAGDVPVYHAFTIGRVRFIISDLRSERDQVDSKDDETKSMMGVAQKAWFKQQLLDAHAKGLFVVWVSSVPWIGSPANGNDNWQSYTAERREIANFMKDNTLHRVMIVSGDAHMLAVDDGTNSDYADDGGAPMVVFQAASLNNEGTIKGGPYSIDPIPGSDQYGLVTVEDDGGEEITIHLSGRRVETERMSYTFTVAMPAPTVPPPPQRGETIGYFMPIVQKP